MMNKCFKDNIACLVFLFIFLICASKSSAERISEDDYAIIHYTHPKIIFYNTVRITDIEMVSAHKVFVGNRGLLDNLDLIVNKIQKRKSNGIEPPDQGGYFIALKLNLKGKPKLEFYLRRNRAFVMKNSDEEITGVLSEDIFDELVSICESMINIIDYKYQWERIK